MEITGSRNLEYGPCGIKLSTGEELFASLDDMYTNGDISISKVYKVHRLFEGIPGSVESKLLYEPWMDYCHGSLLVTRNNIIVCEPLKPRLIQLYLEMLKLTTNMVISGKEEKIAGENPLKPEKIQYH